jgi:hypothetical protein
LLGWFYHTCPNCRARSRRRIIQKKLVNSEAVERTRASWGRGGNMQIKEPYVVWIRTYEVEHVCRSCGHRWTERVTKQRPW